MIDAKTTNGPRRRGALGAIAVALCLGMLACGGSAPPPAPPEPEPLPEADPTPTPDAPPDPTAEAEVEKKPDSAATPTPEFKPGMSVNEAIDAVPQSADRINIEQEALAAPIMNPDVYSPCGMKGHEHFTLKVAVWDGRAVGIDVTTQPKNEKLAACIREQIEKLSWNDKAKSLNTVAYSF